MRSTTPPLVAALGLLLVALAPAAPARADDDDDDARKQAREKLAEQILKEVDARLEKLSEDLREEILEAIERRLAQAPRQAPRAAASPRSTEKELWFADDWADFGEDGWRAELAKIEKALEGYRAYSSAPAKPTLDALAQVERRLERYERALLEGYWTSESGARELTEAADEPLWFAGKWAQWGPGSWRDYFEDLERGLEHITGGGYTHTRSEVEEARKVFAALRVRFQRYERALLEGGWKQMPPLARAQDVPVPPPAAEPAPAQEPAPAPEAEPRYTPEPPAPVRGGFLGVQLGSIDEADPRWRGKLTHGLLIVEVLDGTPAKRGGLREGDVITEVGGRPVTELSEFIDWIGQRAPGDEVRLTIFREDWSKELTVRLGKRP